MTALTTLEVPFEDVILRVSAKDVTFEEVRAAGMDFVERVQSYGARHPAFRRSKGPLELPEDAPAIARQMATASAVAGVGPAYVYRGALVEFVGRAIAVKGRKDVSVNSPGLWFVLARRRTTLQLRSGRDTDPLAVVVKPELGAHGVYSSFGRELERTLPGHDDGVVVVATSTTLAEASATAVRAILARRESVGDALTYLQGLPGLHGAMLVRGDQIGFAGAIEVAA